MPCRVACWFLFLLVAGLVLNCCLLALNCCVSCLPQTHRIQSRQCPSATNRHTGVPFQCCLKTENAGEMKPDVRSNRLCNALYALDLIPWYVATFTHKYDSLHRFDSTSISENNGCSAGSYTLRLTVVYQPRVTRKHYQNVIREARPRSPTKPPTPQAR